jgi:hypothetical protein
MVCGLRRTGVGYERMTAGPAVATNENQCRERSVVSIPQLRAAVAVGLRSHASCCRATHIVCAIPLDTVQRDA